VTDHRTSGARIKQCVAPFALGADFSHEKGDIAIVPGFFISYRNGWTFDDFCRMVSEIGIKGVDLIAPQYWPTLKKYGLLPTMPGLGTAGTPMDGIAAKENHAKYECSTRAMLKQCSEYGAPNMVAMTGPPQGMSYEEAADNTVDFLNTVKSQAEDQSVTICLEILNAVDHPDYVFDHANWGFDVVKRVDSPRVKVLYDIYHSQIQDGDIVRTIRNNIDLIGHIHTAGNPGRRQIDSEQELNYPFIAREIAKLRFTGYVGHEYMPQPDTHALEDLKKAYEIFDLAIDGSLS